MRFLVDAQLPWRLVRLLRQEGHDSLHTLDLPDANRTTDEEINAISVADQRVVVTKDSDFVDSFVLHHQPWKLLLVSTGNISNQELERLFAVNLPAIVNGFLIFDYIDVSQTSIVYHL